MKKLHFILYDEKPDGWDDFVLKHEGFLVQTSHWAMMYEKLGIGKGRYLRAFTNNTILFQTLVNENLLGGTILVDYLPKLVLKTLLNIPFLVSFNFHMAPVFSQSDLEQSTVKSYILQTVLFLLECAKKEHKNIGPADFICFTDQKIALSLLKQLPSELHAKIAGTVRVGIEESEEEMLKKIEYSRRKNIHRAERMGVTIKESGLEKIKLYWKHLSESWKEYHLTVTSEKYYAAFPKDFTQLLFAYKNKELISGNGVLHYGKTSIEFSIFISNFEKKAKTRGGDLVKWQIIKNCIDNNRTIWDLNMIDVTQSEEKTKKINFYKLEWGGKIVYGVEIFYLNPLLKSIRKIKQYTLGK